MSDPSRPPLSPPSSVRLRSGTAARLAGVPVATLRVWERRYGVVAAPKTATGQRLYTSHDVLRLRLIKQLTDRGHAVGTIATLELAELNALAGEDAGPAAFRRLTVVGRATAQKLTGGGCTVVATHEDLDAAERAAAGSADVLVIQLPSLQPAIADRVLALGDRLHAGTVVVVYAFGAESVAEALRAAGATVRREPASGRELARLVAAAPAPAPQRGPEPQPAAAVAAAGGGEPAIRPRRYSDEALALLTEAPSGVRCECPRHVAEIVMQLAGFERYSAECGSRTPADAELHRRLHRVAGVARTIFEQALAELAASEGLAIDEDGGAPERVADASAAR